jgi:hypothetical protein
MNKFQAVRKWLKERQADFVLLGVMIVPAHFWFYWLTAALHSTDSHARLAVILSLGVVVAAMVAGEVYERAPDEHQIVMNIFPIVNPERLLRDLCEVA